MILRRFKASPIVHIFKGLIFFSCGLVVSLVQLVLHLSVKQVDPQLFRKINTHVSYVFNSQIVWLVEWWSGSRVYIHTDPDNLEIFGKESAFLIMNHKYEIDWIMGWTICERVGVLGNTKAYAKKILKWVPIWGWSVFLQEYVFLERNWDKDKKSLGMQLNRLVDYPDPMWLTLFPEGTRFSKSKHAESMEVAKQKGYPLLKHHLLPRTKGFVASLPFLRPSVPAIYDVTIGIRGDAPTALTLIKGIPIEAHLVFRRIPMNTLPQTEPELVEWLQKTFREKDEFMEAFVNNGSFETTLGPKYKTMELKRRPFTFINYVGATIGTLVPLFNYFLYIVFGGKYLQVLAIFFLFLLAHFGVTGLMGLTRVKKTVENGKKQN